MEPTPNVRVVPTPTPPPAGILIIDAAAGLAELLSQHLETSSNHRVEVVTSPADALIHARDNAANPPQCVLFDLVFPGHDGNGLDIILAYGRWCPESALVVYTQGGAEEQALLEIAWSALQPLSVLSRQRPVDHLVETLGEILRTGETFVDLLWRDWLAARRSPWRTRAGYQRLVPHAGHAKMWSALLDAEAPPTYSQLASHSGLSVNTLRNYRSDLVASLELHGLRNPNVRQMFEFAQRVRPLLAPIVAERLAPLQAALA